MADMKLGTGGGGGRRVGLGDGAGRKGRKEMGGYGLLHVSVGTTVADWW